jgi:hypothetical protein
VIVGGPRCGKSWLAREMATASGCARFCGDPRSLVKEPFGGVTYLPEGLAMEDESTRWIVENWFTQPGPWVCEGWIMARALRKWLQLCSGSDSFPCDRVVVLAEQRPELELLPGQVRMHKAVMTVWDQISDYFEGMTDTRRWSEES